MDQSSLVAVGKIVLKGLREKNFGVTAALWVREELESPWLLWLAPRTFQERSVFYPSVAEVLTKYRAKTGYFEITNVRLIEPNHPFLVDLRRYGVVRPEHAITLQSDYIGGFYIKEGLLIWQDI